MFDESGVKFLALVHHVFKICLAHQSEVNTLEELLSGWVNSKGLLIICKCSPILQNDLVCCFDKLFLGTNLLELIVILGFLNCEYIFLLCLTLMNSHQFFDNVKIGQSLNAFLYNLILLLLGRVNVI